MVMIGKRMRNGYQNTGNGIARAYHAGAWIFLQSKNVFDEKGLLGLKAFISNITLPVVLFNAFLCAEYNAKIVVLFVLIYVGYLLAIGTGLLLNKTGKAVLCLCRFCWRVRKAECSDMRFTD